MDEKNLSIQGSLLRAKDNSSLELFFDLLNLIFIFFICTISFLSNFIYNCSTFKPAKSNLSIKTPFLSVKIRPTRTNVSKIKTIFSFLAILECTLLIILSLIIYLGQKIDTTSVVFVPKGNISNIITYLGNRNFNISPTIDKYLLVFIGRPQAGWINIGSTSLSKGDFLYHLANAKAATKSIIIYPGETTELILQLLAREYNLSYDELRNSYDLKSSLEDGMIVPETYAFPIGISADHLISYLLKVSQATHENMSKKIFKNYDKNRWKRYLIIASIIQKEAGNEKEMPIVSSVIYNRLRKGMKLQMDGALNYGKHSHIGITARRIDEDNSKFNTYKHRGLPPYPICVVSPAAIKASIFPKKTNYLYFVRDKKSRKNGHIFSTNYKSHVNEILRQKKIR